MGDTTTCASGMLAPVDGRERPQAQGAKVRTQGAKVRTHGAKGRANISTSQYRKQQQHATTTTTTTTVVFPLYQLVQAFHLHMWWLSPDATCLHWWCFFTQSVVQIVHLHTWYYHPLQLVLVVLFHLGTGANTALALRQLYIYIL